MRATLYAIVLFTLSALPLRAQETDSVFPGYAAYAHFVDQHISTRDFTEVILRLGGRDEYTKEEIASLQRQFDGIWSANFQNGTVFNRQDLGGGVSQEAEKMGVPLLAALPIDLETRLAGDQGVPVAAGSGPMADAYAQLAQGLVKGGMA